MRLTNNDWHNITVGDVVTAYYAGTWLVTAIEKRQYDRDHGYQPAPLVILKKLYNKNCSSAKPIVKECDISWCTKLTEEKLSLIKEFNEKFFK